MKEAVLLGRKQIVEERPFTNPDHIIIDKVILRTMIDDIRRHLRTYQREFEIDYSHYFPSETVWQKRMIVTQPTRIFSGEKLTIVGFFGKKRAVITPQVSTQIAELGHVFCQQIRQMPTILGYYTWLLADEMNYANLVLLAQNQAIAEWRHTKPHVFAKDQLSPQYYDCVRIYNGRFSYNPSTRRQKLKLNRVKYWDYRAPEIWHAVRELKKAK